MAAVEVSKEIFERLGQAYLDKLGRSTKSLINILNRTYSQEQDSGKEDLIFDRTLRSFFNSSYDHSKPPKMQERNLSYLWGVLLDGKSYREIEEKLRKLNTQDLNIHSDWLKPYWNSLRSTPMKITIFYFERLIPIDGISVQLNALGNISKNRRKKLKI